MAKEVGDYDDTGDKEKESIAVSGYSDEFEFDFAPPGFVDLSKGLGAPLAVLGRGIDRSALGAYPPVGFVFHDKAPNVWLVAGEDKARSRCPEEGTEPLGDAAGASDSASGCGIGPGGGSC